MNDKPRKQLSLRFDNYAELLAEAKKYCKDHNVKLTDLVATGLRLAMTSQQASQMPSHDKPNIDESRLANIENRLANVEDRLSQYQERQATTSQAEPIAPNPDALQETIESLLEKRFSHHNSILNDLNNRLAKLEKQREAAIRSVPIPQFPTRVNTPAPQPDTQPAAVTKGDNITTQYICPKCGVVGEKGKDFTSKGENSVGNKRLKCRHCNTVRVDSTFLENKLEPKNETWQEKTSDFLDEVKWS